MHQTPTPARTPTPALGPAGTNCDTLEDETLLARILGRASDDPARLAARLMAVFGTLGAVAAADPHVLARVGGAAPEAIEALKIARALAVRLARDEARRRPVIASWSALLAYVRVALAHLPREQFRVLYLDGRNQLVRDEWMAEGSVDHAPVYPREVVRRALELSASAMILVHNHPSGDPTPSRADIEMTRQVVDGARLFGLQVHDHLVVGREGTTSFKSLGLI